MFSKTVPIYKASNELGVSKFFIMRLVKRGILITWTPPGRSRERICKDSLEYAKDLQRLAKMRKPIKIRKEKKFADRVNANKPNPYSDRRQRCHYRSEHR